SGGQAAKAGLAAILLARFDVFLLDEPTNNLDFAGLDRLERFLESLPGGVVVVSHDRAFLDRAVTRIVEIEEESHRAREFAGGGDGVRRRQGGGVRRRTSRLGPIDVEIGWQDRVAILGPNGSGKTTLLRALLGTIPLTSGDRWLGPRVVVGELDQSRHALAAD